MPQMMPMLWSLMFMFMILVTLMTVSFFFFINTPNIMSPKYKSITCPQWSWMW